MKLTDCKYNVHIQAHILKVSKHSVTILGQRVVTPAGLEPGQIVPPPPSE